jgi:hypothetical protein
LAAICATVAMGRSFRGKTGRHDRRCGLREGPTLR